MNILVCTSFSQALNALTYSFSEIYQISHPIKTTCDFEVLGFNFRE